MRSILSPRDTNVLGTLLSNDDLTQQQAPASSPSSKNTHDSLEHAISPQERNAVLRLNSDDPSQESILASIADLNEIVERDEATASTYANRAQARRLLVPSSQLFASSNLAVVEAILQDLDEAIALSLTDKCSAILSQISNHRALSAAYAHKGFMLLCTAQASKAGMLDLSKGRVLANYNLDELENAANQAFTEGGRFGSNVARQMAVRTNPYAKMCGSILKQSLRQEHEMA